MNQYTKAECYNIKPTLVETSYNINQQPCNKHVFNQSRNSFNIVESRMRFINESSHCISIIQGSGITIDLPPANVPRNQLLIYVTLQWGSDCKLNLGAIRRHVPYITDTELTELLHNVKQDVMDHKTHELTVCYKLPLEGFKHSPNGIWVEDLNVQVVPTHYVEEIVHHPKDSPRLDIEDDEFFTAGSIIGINYYTDNPNVTEPLYLLFGNDALYLHPTYELGFKPGVHIQLNGKATFAAGINNSNKLYIAPANYRKYGIYNSAREIIEIIKRDKGVDREQLERMVNCFNEHHPKPDPVKTTIKDIYITENITVGDVIDFVQEIGKIDAVITRLFK